MGLMDSADGVFMTAAYDWALASPVRKLYYNLIITALSVTVALHKVGTIRRCPSCTTTSAGLIRSSE